MRTSGDPRHLVREKVLRALFAYPFQKATSIKNLVALKIYNDRVSIDKLISVAAPERNVNRINRVDLAILRQAVWELKERKQPQKVIINEAVELAKKYGSESSSAFVNGVLGTILKNTNKVQCKKKE